jgi:hypothetical protein
MIPPPAVLSSPRRMPFVHGVLVPGGQGEGGGSRSEGGIAI